MLSEDVRPERRVIDFQQRNVVEAQTYNAVFKRVKSLVLPDRRAKAEAGKGADGEMRPHHRQFLERWWKLSWDRADMFEAFAGRYIVCSRLTKRPVLSGAR